MPNEKIPPSFRKKRRLGLIALTPIMATMALSPQFTQAAAAKSAITATAKYDTKIGKVVVAGKTATTISAGAKVTAYDATNNIILYTSNSNAKNAFSMQLLGATSVPCMVRLEVINPKDNSQSQVLLPVTGADASCKTVPVCGITKPVSDTEITVGSSLTFASETTKTGSYVWSMGDGSADETQATVNHKFTDAGKYRVQLAVTNNGMQCTDEIMVSVVPPAGTNPNPKVSEQPQPALASAMPKGAANDTNAVVVLPFEETGMQGGSQITLPYNPLTPYNALNAQVIKKLPSKPAILDKSEVELSYSAASNPKDPAGKDSINSTSQNMFTGGKSGVNFDPKTTTCDTGCVAAKTETKLIPGQDFVDAGIAKSEFWDRNHQNYTTDGVQRGQNIFDSHNTVTLNGVKQITKPDEGRRGFVDLGKGVKAMPGIANPYKTNDPQKLDYNADQAAFVAQNIPASSVDDQGRVNPYPLMRVEAKSQGKVIAKTDVVYTTASETRCRECHAKGEIAGDANVWRTPVVETELRNADGTPGPATGEGSFKRSNTPTTIPADKANTLDGFKEFGYGAAIHNAFNETHVEYNLFGGTAPFSSVPATTKLEFDANGVRKDRVSESRYWNLKTNTACQKGDADCKLQIKLKFKAAEDYGDKTDWRAQEKAALFNTELLHDYMTKYYGQYSGPGIKKITDLKNVGVTDPTKLVKQFSTGYATTFSDQSEEKLSGPLSAQCAGHHTSQVKADFGAGAQAYQGSLSNFSNTMHAFHGKMQVYKEDVAKGADNQPHKKGDLIRDDRGHPVMYGGRGWDGMFFDNNNVRQKAAGTVKVDTADPAENTAANDSSNDLLTNPAQAGTKDDPRNLWDTKKNDWDPDTFKMHPKGELLYKFGGSVPMEENCAKCHTGKTEKSYRDVHHAAGLKCDSCHSDMLAVGNSYRNEKYNYNLTAAGALGEDNPNTLTIADTRRPWIDQPDCGSCHIGDGNIKKEGDKNQKNVFSSGVLKQAWKEGDKSGASMFPIDARFAIVPLKENRLEKATATDADVTAGLAAKKGDTIFTKKPLSQSLYRKSSDVHGSGANGALTCSTCHGGSHSVWPNADPNANDNQTAKQLQGYDGNIAECSVCHVKDDFKTGLVATDGGTSGLGVAQGMRDGKVVDSSSAKAFLAGPHGMHPVGDLSWYSNNSTGKPNGGWHASFTRKAGPDGEDQCAACHGADHKGTRLSKSLVDRTLTNGKGKAIKIAKGQVIGCDLCHTMAKSFNGAPNGVAKLHAPNAPELIGTHTGAVGGH